jgi:hypothetical protein
MSDDRTAGQRHFVAKANALRKERLERERVYLAGRQATLKREAAARRAHREQQQLRAEATR